MSFGLRQSVKRNSQPQNAVKISSSPLTKDLCFAFNAATPEIDLVSLRSFTKTASFASGVGGAGKFVYTTSANTPALTIPGYAPIKTTDGTGSGDFTIIALAAPSAAATARGIFSQRDGASPFMQVDLVANGYISTATSGAVGVTTYNSTGYEARTTSTSYIDGSVKLIGAQRSGTSLSFWMNGVNDTAVTTTGTPAALDVYDPSNQETAIGGIGEYSSGYGALNTPIYLVFAWNRLLSAAEHQQLATNPWQIFQPLERRIWVPSAGGGITVTPSAAIARALGIAPALVLGSTSTTPAAAIAKAAAVAPTTILGSLAIVPAVAAARAAAQVGGVVLGSLVIAPAVAAAKAAAVVGAVLGGAGLTVTAAAAVARCAAVISNVVLGSVSVTPVAAVARAMARIGNVIGGATTTVYKRIVRGLVRALTRDNIDPPVG